MPSYHIGCLQIKVPGDVIDNGVITEDVATLIEIDISTTNDSQCYLG